ncbi:MAG: hydrogenase maturation protease [Brevinematia bacterium]
MKIKIVGIGHALGGDDFVGIKVVEELSNEIFDDNIEFITTMDPSRIIYLIEESDLMIVVDAVIGEKEGEVYIINYENFPKYLKPISSHGFEVPFAVETAKKLGIDISKKLKIVGITIKEIVMYSDELSEEVRKAIPKAKEVIKKLLNQVQ